MKKPLKIWKYRLYSKDQCITTRRFVDASNYIFERPMPDMKYFEGLFYIDITDKWCAVYCSSTVQYYVFTDTYYKELPQELVIKIQLDNNIRAIK